jgi:hypothetical protein
MVCVVCGFDHKEKERRVVDLTLIKQAFQKSLTIKVVEESKEEDYFDTPRLIQIAMASMSAKPTSVSLPTQTAQQPQQLPQPRVGSSDSTIM